MQRTTALREASEKHPDILGKAVRIEFWIARSVHSLVYRMLVLNTGQVPWTLSRQLSVVYRSLISEISENVTNLSRVIEEDDSGRRVNAGEFKASILVELYLSFSSRKSKLDSKQAVSEQFAQLDFVENLSRHEFQEQFYSALTYMVKLDKEFDRYLPDEPGVGRFKRGRNIFDSNPARIGFIVAFGQYVLGRAGTTRGIEEQEKRLNDISKKLEQMIKKISSISKEELGVFLNLDMLQQSLEVRSGKVGEFERTFFEKAFSVLIDLNSELDSMEPCWRAY